MGLFSRSGGDSDIEERLAKLERKHRELETEWVSFYEKAQQILGRLIKRQSAIAPRVDDVPDPDRGSEGQLDAISAAIKARRKAGHGLLPPRRPSSG